jgi:signal transduction histidine kinase
MGELRSLIFELRPASLEAEGLATTLRKHVDVLRRVSGQEVVLRADGAPRLPPDVESEVFRVAQEALQNAVRHADAGRIDVRLTNGDGRLVLEVSDDGAGFDPAAPGVRSRRLGLTSMEERAAALGGSLAIESAPGGGTRVRLEVPTE